MSRDHRPLLPQLLVLFREDEDGSEEQTAETTETEVRVRHLHGLSRGESTRKAG